MDDVHTIRTLYGADVVALMVDIPDSCGVGYVGPLFGYMFSVTSWLCAAGYYSLAHEIGHNLVSL